MHTKDWQRHTYSDTVSWLFRNYLLSFLYFFCVYYMFIPLRNKFSLLWFYGQKFSKKCAYREIWSRKPWSIKEFSSAIERSIESTRFARNQNFHVIFHLFFGYNVDLSVRFVWNYACVSKIIVFLYMYLLKILWLYKYIECLAEQLFA